MVLSIFKLSTQVTFSVGCISWNMYRTCSPLKPPLSAYSMAMRAIEQNMSYLDVVRRKQSRQLTAQSQMVFFLSSELFFFSQRKLCLVYFQVKCSQASM